jgi:hypothetical protein
MLRAGRTLAAAVALIWASAASPASAEYWKTDVFLQQPPEDQIIYMIGLVDMYEHVVDEIAPDPDDWVMPCLRGMTPSDLRIRFVTWLLEGDLAAWRFNPSKLFLEAVNDLCGRPVQP